MSNLDNHMDELFQKAAENYPLKTSVGNFDDLMPFIAGKTTTTEHASALKRKRKTIVLLLAILVSGVSISTYLIKNTGNNKTADNKAVLQHKPSTSANNKTFALLHVTKDLAVDAGNTNTGVPPATQTSFQKNRPSYNTRGNMFTNITGAVAVTDDDITATENNNVAIKEAFENTVTVETANKQPVNTVNQNSQTKKEIIDQTDKKGEKEKLKPADKKNKDRPGIYYGIAAGIEFNKVKTQGMTKATFNGGIILGLQINKKLAAETGVQLSQKKYYSDGKYFKAKSGSMPANMTVNSLESTSTIIEIPVSVKYNFSKKKNTLYGKAGVSSYIITKESNKYQAVVSGQQQEVNSTYTANKGYLASDVRISAGYQHAVSKKSNMRIEPYIQLPLKGLGVGSLPVTTAGIQIVLTRN